MGSEWTYSQREALIGVAKTIAEAAKHAAKAYAKRVEHETRPKTKPADWPVPPRKPGATA